MHCRCQKSIGNWFQMMPPHCHAATPTSSRCAEDDQPDDALCAAAAAPGPYSSWGGLA
jgi:hypothetical protein